MSFAILFPGQGAQFPGMAQRWYDELPEVRELFAIATEKTGLPMEKLCFETSRGEQARTDWTQPCVLLSSLSGLISLRNSLKKMALAYMPDSAGGHSLGHFSALVAAGVLSPTVAFDLVYRRGRLMYEAGLVEPGGMMALIGITPEQVLESIRNCTNGKLSIAATNGPDQVVVSGDERGLSWMQSWSLANGVERTVPLAIGIAAHSEAMGDAESALAESLADVDFRPPNFPVALNTQGTLTQDVLEIRTDLLQQMTKPVLWWQCLQAMQHAGTRQFIDVGPGRTIGKVLSRYLPEETVVNNDRPNGPKGLLA